MGAFRVIQFEGIRPTIAIAHVSITVHSVHGRKRLVFVNVLQLTMLVLLAYLI